MLLFNPRFKRDGLALVQLVGFDGLSLVVVYDVQNGHRAKYPDSGELEVKS